MPKSTPTSLTQAIQHLFAQHNGEFRPADFLNIATELGFQLQPTPPAAPKLSYHTQQQPGAGYWATAPGAADISEGMVWVSTEATEREGINATGETTMPKFTGS